MIFSRNSKSTRKMVILTLEDSHSLVWKWEWQVKIRVRNKYNIISKGWQWYYYLQTVVRAKFQAMLNAVIVFKFFFRNLINQSAVSCLRQVDGLCCFSFCSNKLKERLPSPAGKCKKDTISKINPANMKQFNNSWELIWNSFLLRQFLT